MNPNPNHLNCAACGAQLMDALDGLLSPEQQLAFDRHIASCSACRLMLEDAQRGAAWLEMLKADRPEPPADLVNRIIVQTSGTQAVVPQAVPQLVPQPAIAGRGNILSFPRRWSAVAQTRLAMTAAMAFFSIALSANLLGLSFSSLRPGNVENSLYRAQARAIQYYDNLNVVAQLESHLHDFQRLSTEDSDQPSTQPTQQPSDKPSGSSRRDTPQQPSGILHAACDRLALPAGCCHFTQEGAQA